MAHGNGCGVVAVVDVVVVDGISLDGVFVARCGEVDLCCEGILHRLA